MNKIIIWFMGLLIATGIMVQTVKDVITPPTAQCEDHYDVFTGYHKNLKLNKTGELNCENKN
ncbi:MAG: hypothetical protein K2X86_00080 [Cytophagaceae bacterium]|nr:hypothetical protein [Cytophagaceae bacterium]